MSRFVPRRLEKRERKLVVDALLRAAAETRETLSKMASSKVLDPKAIEQHRATFAAMLADQERLASNLDDSSLEIDLVLEIQRMPHERAGSGTINKSGRR